MLLNYLEVVFYGHTFLEPKEAIKCTRGRFQPHRLPVRRKELFHCFTYYTECPLWAGTVLEAGDIIWPQPGACLQGPTSKELPTVPSLSTMAAKGAGSPRPTEEVSRTYWRDRDTSPKEVGLRKKQKSCLGAHLWDGVCCGNGTANEN